MRYRWQWRHFRSSRLADWCRQWSDNAKAFCLRNGTEGHVPAAGMQREGGGDDLAHAVNVRGAERREDVSSQCDCGENDVCDHRCTSQHSPRVESSSRAVSGEGMGGNNYRPIGRGHEGDETRCGFNEQNQNQNQNQNQFYFRVDVKTLKQL
jgi:hypothetical protein